MNRLEDIQKNPSEFNIKFNMIELIGYAMLNTFAIEENKKIMEDTVCAARKITPLGYGLALIACKFDELVDEFLKGELEEKE